MFGCNLSNAQGVKPPWIKALTGQRTQKEPLPRDGTDFMIRVTN